MTGAWATSADFTDANMTGACLVGAKLSKANMNGVDLWGADLFHADLGGASLRNAVLAGVNVGDANMDKTDLTGVVGTPPHVVYVDDRALTEILSAHEKFCASHGAEGEAAKFGGADFRPIRQMRRRKLTGLSAPGSIMVGLDLEGVELQGADLFQGRICAAPTSRTRTCAAHG